MQTLVDLFETLESRGDQTAIIYRTGIRRFVYSYREIYELSLKFSVWLKDQGIIKGDKIIIWAPNSPWWVVAFFGSILSGAVVVPVDFASGQDRVNKISELAMAKFVIQSQYKFDKFQKEKGINIEEIEFLIASFSPSKVQPDLINRKDLVELIYTSGTTGDPKGVMLSHKNLIANLRQVNSHVKLDSSYTFLSLLPLSHMFEQISGFLSPLYLGGSIVYIRTLKPSAILEAFKEENIYVAVCVPRLLNLLKSSIERQFQNKNLGGLFNSLLSFANSLPDKFRKFLFYPVHTKFGKNFKFFVSGGATLDIATAKFWQKLGFKILEGYGLTEASPILSSNTPEKQVLGSVGLVLPEVQIKLVNNEILAKGENIFEGYYNNKEATDNVFTEDGWLKTGDLGEFDQKGYLKIKGRSKDMIVTGAGINVYPNDVETVLNNILGVKESCVLGIDQGNGEEVFAALILANDSYHAEEIIQKANNILDPEQQITGYRVWPFPEFPKTTTLKVQKFLVKKEIQKKQSEHPEEIPKDKLLFLVGKVTGKSASAVTEDSVIVRELGLTSIARLELVNLLELEFRVDLDDNLINQNTTVADLRRTIINREQFKTRDHFLFWPNKPWARIVRYIADAIIVYPAFKYYIKLSIENHKIFETLKPPVVFISNHLSFGDHSVIYLALKGSWHSHTATAAWEEFFFPNEKVSRMKKFFRYISFYLGSLFFNLFPLSQAKGFRSTLGFMGKLVDKNINILIFPEGTRSETGELLPFMSGIGIIVKELKIPVVPIKLSGIDKILHRNMSWPKRGKVIVKFGSPLNFTKESINEIVEKCRQAVSEL